MVAKKPVNVIIQMVFAVIPILDIYASYRIQKLRWWLLIFWIGGITIGFLYDEIFFDSTLFVQFINNGSYALEYLGFVIALAITQAFVMRLWSKKWNLEFDNTPNITE